MKLEGHRTNRHLVLTPSTWAQLLVRIASNRDTPGGRELFVRLAGTWGRRPDRAYVTFRPTTQERQILRGLTVIPSNGQPGRTTTKESRMARKAKAAPVDDIDELEAELEGLEEVDVDEPEVEDDDDDEGEDLSSMTVAQLKTHAKGLGIKGTDKKNKAALLALIEAADVEDEEEDEEEEDEVEDEVEEDEDDGLDDMSRAELKAHIKSEALDVRVMKSDSDADIVAKIREASDEDDDEEEDDEEPAPKAKGKGKATPAKKATGKKGPPPGSPGPRALPNGKLGANDIAELAGTSALNVRNFLRSDNGAAWPKNEELGRYAFTTKQAQAIVKAMGSRSGTGTRGPRTATKKTTTKGKAKKK